MVVLGAEIVLVLIMALGGLLLALAMARSMNANKSRVQQDRFMAGSPPSDSPHTNVDDIRTRVERRYRRRYELAAHIVMFLFILAGLLLLRVPPPAVALLGGVWALVLTVHGLKVVFDEFSDRAIEHEIERERAQTYESDKPKRDWQVRLSDEGELIEIIEDEPEVDDKQKRRG